MNGAKSLYNNGKSVIARDTAEVAAHAAAIRADRKTLAVEARSYTRLTREQIVGASMVFVFGFGWRVVVQVNEKTVTVLEPSAWDKSWRYPFDRIVQARS